MAFCTDTVCAGEGVFALEAVVTVTPRGIVVYACTPAFAHLGATAQAIPRPEPGRTATVSLLAVPCHRDEIPAHDIAAALATEFAMPCSASTGYHVENASPADLQKTLDKTEDEETRESLQANLDSMKQWREDYEKSGKYQISPEQIASYRAFGENMAVQQSLIWNTNEGSTQVQQYLDGAMNAQQLAAALEKTLQMQKLEGN